MRQLIIVGALVMSTLAAPAASAPASPLAAVLPPKAQVVVTQEAELTGDRTPELIVAYTLPRDGLPPTEGRAAVLERTAGGGYRRFDLPGAWGGHYLPSFTVRDLTGDGRPELVLQVAGGGAWEMLSVIRRAPGGGYTALLTDPAGRHAIWDADGDGLPEVLGNSKLGSPAHRRTESFRWLGDRYLAWHTAVWNYGGEFTGPGAGRAAEVAVPRLVGLPLPEAVRRSPRPPGMIVPVDSAAPAGQVVAQTAPSVPEGGQVHLAVSAGSTVFAAGPFPGVRQALSLPADLQDQLGVPAGSTPPQRRRWDEWLSPVLRGARQVVHLTSYSGPAYMFALAQPWAVCAGGRWISVEWVGVGLAEPYRGLILLADRASEWGPLWPEWTTAVYTSVPATARTPAPARPLARYLREQPELEGFVTLSDQSWAEALRIRSIRPEGWPSLTADPPLTGDAPLASPYTPDPDHATVTVLSGRVRRARRQGNDVWVDLEPRPGEAQRWLLDLRGFPMGMTPRVHLLGPDPRTMALHTPIPISGYKGPPPGE